MTAMLTWRLCVRVLSTALLLLQDYAASEEVNFHYTEGKRVVLYCEKSDQRWTKDSKPFSAINNSLAEITKTAGGYTKLKIRKLKPEDAGIYACGNTKFKIEVHEPRNLTAIRRELTVPWSKSAKLSCSFTNKDDRRSSLFVRWYFRGKNGEKEIQVLPSKRHSIYWHKAKKECTLIVRNVEKIDEGNYKCAGGPLDNLKEAEDIIHLNISGIAPQMQKGLPEILEKNEGDNVSLTCGASGYPPPTFTWFREQVMLDQGRELMLRNVTKADSGAFACVARNENGNATHTWKLSINGMRKHSSVTKRLVAPPQFLS
ncbi:neural cell adhesion molecule 2-like [Oscarella lobularis]|uniref:neural cell adhesion molecule 2-like n=1 Tax=Oscarella lobularis TaxID=121494 RepID=UPI00331373DC